jgi:hypothetical protein
MLASDACSYFQMTFLCPTQNYNALCALKREICTRFSNLATFARDHRCLYPKNLVYKQFELPSFSDVFLPKEKNLNKTRDTTRRAIERSIQ